jgi:hypothetical protein
MLVEKYIKYLYMNSDLKINELKPVPVDETGIWMDGGRSEQVSEWR